MNESVRDADLATAARTTRLRYVGYPALDGVPNVIVDGAATDGTVLTLSHWPQSPIPPGLQADLSAQMAFAYLYRGDLHTPAEVVSNNHFDQDGLVSVFALTDPTSALDRRALLTDVAAAGDFATYRQRDAARVSMTISAFADADRSPLGPPPADYGAWTATLYEELLGRLVELSDHPDRYRQWWAEEDATLTASEELFASGRVAIEEVSALDLAVLTIPTDAPDAGGHRFGGRWVKGLHPMAVNNATERGAVLSVRDHRYEFTYRYESWVQYHSRRPRLRVDLGPLADELTADEPGNARWVWEGASVLTPRLYLDGGDDSAIDPEPFRARLERFLTGAPPAWDPYRSPGGSDH
jgi:hypothetical protein